MIYDYDVKFNHKLYKAGEYVPISPVFEEENERQVVENKENEQPFVEKTKIEEKQKKGRAKKG